MLEPEWDEDTRTMALAYDAVEMCPRCGGPAYLCQDSANQDNWQIPAPVRCHRITALRTAQKPFTEKTNPVVEALVWRTVLATDERR